MVEIRSGKASLNASYSMLFSVTHRVKCNNAGVCHLLLYGRHLQKCRFQKSTGLIKAIPKNRMIGLLILVFLRQDQVQQNCHNCGNDHRRLTEQLHAGHSDGGKYGDGRSTQHALRNRR